MHKILVLSFSVNNQDYKTTYKRKQKLLQSSNSTWQIQSLYILHVYKMYQEIIAKNSNFKMRYIIYKCRSTIKLILCLISCPIYVGGRGEGCHKVTQVSSAPAIIFVKYFYTPEYFLSLWDCLIQHNLNFYCTIMAGST